MNLIDEYILDTNIPNHLKKTEHKQMEEKQTINLKVSGKSDPSKVAGAIVKYMHEQCEVEITTIGASAINQAVKALAIARGMVGTSGYDLSFIVGFAEETIDDELRTAIKFFPIKTKFGK
jgi:stage V sporulation protein S